MGAREGRTPAAALPRARSASRSCPYTSKSEGRGLALTGVSRGSWGSEAAASRSGGSVAACPQQVFVAQKLSGQELFLLFSPLLRCGKPDHALATDTLIVNDPKQEEICLWNTSVSVEG